MKYLKGHTDETNAYLVEDYPWGFKLRTSQRHWVESKKGFGERHVTQTLNPKTGKWCKPKKSTYSDIVILGIDEKTGYLTSDGWGISYTDEKELNAFLDRVGYDNLTPFQQNMIKRGRAIIKVRSHITYEVKPSPVGPISISGLMNKDPIEMEKAEREEKRQEAHKKEQADVHKNIGKALNYYSNQEGVQS